MDMGSHWFLLLLLLLSRDRAFNLPSGASVGVLASDSPSTESSVSNRNLPYPSTNSSLPHSMKGHDSTEEPNSSSVTETPTSKSQDQMTSPTLPASPQSRGTAGPTEQMTSTVHTPAITVTNSMSLSDFTMTSAVKESIVTSKTTVLFSLAISSETPQLNQIPPSSTLDKARDTHEPLPTTTVAVTNTPSSTTVAAPSTAVLSTDTAETQEKDTAAVPPTPATPPTTSKPPDPQSSSVTQTPSQPAQTDSSIGTGTAQSPEHPTGLVHNASETTKSSTIIGTSPAPRSSSQSSGPGGGACALDEYLDSTRGCMCSNSYYFHLAPGEELLLEASALGPEERCLSGCSSTNTTDQGHRVQVFQLEKKEGTCGLHISTNVSHALYSVNVHLEEARLGSGSRVLHFSCAYPLVVNVSKPVSYQEASIPTIHIPGIGETVITLSVFTDLELHRPLEDRTAPVGMPLYVVLKSTSSDPDQFSLVANEVFASDNISNTVAKATYHFVNESCPVGDRLLQDLNNGASIQVTLAFILSRFLNSDTLYLHAQVTLCDKQASRPCQPSPRASSSRSRAGAWMSILLLIVTGWMLD